MFLKIFRFEFQYWLKKPLFYIYMALMLVLSTITMAGALGVFDANTVTVTGIRKINSSLGISNLLSGFNFLTYFLLPSIIGSSIYKDYKTDMYQVLFSYPFTKSQYLLVKFSSSFFISVLVVLCSLVGLIIGTFLPGVNTDLLIDFKLINFLQPFLLLIIPNLLFFGVIVFGVVTFSRNIFVGFVVVLILIILQGLAGNYLSDLDTKNIAALLDPMSGAAIRYETEYWTVAEQNTNLIPYQGHLLYNRLIWLAVSFIIFLGIFHSFAFQQNGISFSFLSKNKKRDVKRNFGGYHIRQVLKVQFNFSKKQYVKNLWRYSNFHLQFILKNWAFISIICAAILMLILMFAMGNQIQGTKTLPVTRMMIAMGKAGIGLFMIVLIFLFSGMLIHRAQISKMNELIDTTPQPTWMLIGAKFLAILKMIVVVLAATIMVSLLFQTYKGFYDYELGLYLFSYYFVEFINYIILALLAFFVHSLLKNYIVGFIVLLGLLILLSFFPMFGIQQQIFNFNEISSISYSDMDGFGHSLPLYYIYKLYWLFLGICMFIAGILYYHRGSTIGFKERRLIARKRFSNGYKLVVGLCLVLFVILGSYIYYINNIANEQLLGKESELARANYEKEFRHYKTMEHPRITATKINMQLYPNSRDYRLKAEFTLENKTDKPIDSIFLRKSKQVTQYRFSKATSLSVSNEIYDFDVLQLTESLLPGESMKLNFSMKNLPNTWFYDHSPVKHNGTFINNGFLPSFGYDKSYELSSDEIREKNDLGYKENFLSPHDPEALKNTYLSNEADWIDFEATISTSEDQIAIAPGYLVKEWQEGDRKFFTYKMEDKMLNFYNIMSAHYSVKEEMHDGIKLQIFYYPRHTYNLDRMLEGAKSGLTYYQKYYSDYQFRQLRIIEFPSTIGTFAQAFANTVPFSEGIGFIADVREEEEGEGVDYPFAVTAHEVAHQWWAHQVIGANAQGSTLMSESVAEYSSLKVLEKRYGELQMRRFLKEALDKYLSGRRYENQQEHSLLYNRNKPYIHYNKGSLVLYAISDYVGEEKFNAILSDYLNKVAFQEAPYTTSLEFANHLKTNMPDSLQYMVTDMIEYIRLYDNKMLDYKVTSLENGNYQVTIRAQVSKYESLDYGDSNYIDYENCSLTEEIHIPNEENTEVQSLPLKDYVEVGIFTTNEDGEEKVLYLEKHLIEKIENEWKIEVSKKPTEVGIDPYHKLIDRNSDDNTVLVK
ncbi:M1 family aminopeptidase [Mesonia ostreae]|uniref:M1 family aminopeptidase n=1 Tax=Mesonia ostreae TaxID=861110 RepID=A0ABU2KIT2_9FLAO|nr:M1 family aminopeptidase [Mesonia ostreae]MDT0294589.1 M1 family aminopeptidase [Mesonia ostreae]